MYTLKKKNSLVLDYQGYLPKMYISIFVLLITNKNKFKAFIQTK